MRPTTALIALTLTAMIAPRARADDEPATAPVDRSRYTLFDPVPTEALRDMQTDRPDRVNGPYTIDAGHVQLEVGAFDYLFSRDKYLGANVRTDRFVFGEVNARVGLTDRVELALVVDPVDVIRSTDYGSHVSSRAVGVGDVLLGGKINLVGDDDPATTWGWALAVQPQFNSPSARPSIGNGRAEASLGFPFTIALPGDFHLGFQTTPGWERNDADTGYLLGWQNAVSVDRGLTPDLDLFVEYWNHVTTAHHRMAEQTIDTGFVYTLNPRVQLDTGVFLGLNRATPSIEWTAGFTIRI